MTSVRSYRMTISSVWYDEQLHKAREYELHFKASRRGSIRTVRRHLARRGVPYFQGRVYRLFERWIRKHKVKVSFEREKPTLSRKSDRLIHVEMRRMEGVGKRKRWRAYPLPSRVLSYAKRKRKRRTR